MMLNISKGLAGGIFAGLVPARLSIAQPSRIDNQPFCSKTTIVMPTISVGGGEYLTRESDKVLN
jgi:hypothetical protein